MISISFKTISQMQTRGTPLRNHGSQIKRLFRLVGTCYKIPSDAKSDFFLTTLQRLHLSHLCTYALELWMWWFSKEKQPKRHLITLPSTRKPCFSWFPNEATTRKTLKTHCFPQETHMFPCFRKKQQPKIHLKHIVLYIKTTYVLVSERSNKGKPFKKHSLPPEKNRI